MLETKNIKNKIGSDNKYSTISFLETTQKTSFFNEKTEQLIIKPLKYFIFILFLSQQNCCRIYIASNKFLSRKSLLIIIVLKHQQIEQNQALTLRNTICWQIMKNKEAGKPQNLLQVLQNQIQVLTRFSFAQLQYLFQNHQIIIFSRGMLLAKHNQMVDYIGLVLNGSALAEKTKKQYKKGSIIGNILSLGLDTHQKHCQNITGQSDGILFALRIQTLLQPTKSDLQLSVKNKIIKYLSEENLCNMKGTYQHFKSSLQLQFEQLDDKINQKLIQNNKSLSQFLQIFQPKQKSKFLECFPINCVKQKSQIISKSAKPYLLLLIKGQIAVKYGLGLKKQTKIIETSTNNITLYNSEGFIFGHTQYVNGYCLSNQAIFVLIDKEVFETNFKLNTQINLLKYCLDHQMKSNEYDPINSLKKIVNQNQLLMDQSSKKDIWNPFMKNFKIQQMPKKDKNKSETANHNSVHKKKQTLSTLQSLYQTFNSSKHKPKTKETLFTQQNQINGPRVPTIKTQISQDMYSSSVIGNDRTKKLQSEIYALKQQNKILSQEMKARKLQLLQTQCKLKMINVFKEIKLVSDAHYKANINTEKNTTKSGQGNLTTLKNVFQDHLKQKKLDLLVAKCAYKWLDYTRKNRQKRQNRMQNSSLIKSSIKI